MITIHDPWKHLRAECFGNVEPIVRLQAITTRAVMAVMVFNIAITTTPGLFEDMDRNRTLHAPGITSNQ